MSVCPKCRKRLLRTKSNAGFFFRCPECDGRAVGLAVMRRAVPPQYVRALWTQARHGSGTRGQPCPVCCRRMAEIPLPIDGREVRLDVCAGCQFVWFDPHEFEQLPAQPRTAATSDRPPLPKEVCEAMAMVELELDQARRNQGDFGSEPPDDTWKWIPALFGMPVEHDVHPVRGWPWVTWGLAVLMALTVAATVANLHEVAEAFGLVPAMAWRHGGMTFVTSFFLHAGLMHLIGNAYFLLIFGDNVEDHLGRWRYALLIAAAALAGDLLHIMADPRSMTPCIGASGSISGVIAFYALNFPRARLSFLFGWFVYFRWIHVPAWFALLGWVLWQIVLAQRQLAGLTDVSALAHLGGAGVGVLAWLLWREGGDAAERESFRSLRRDPRSR